MKRLGVLKGEGGVKVKSMWIRASENSRPGQPRHTDDNN